MLIIMCSLCVHYTEQWFVIDCPGFVSLNSQLVEVKGCDWVWSYDVMTSDNLFILSL